MFDLQIFDLPLVANTSRELWKVFFWLTQPLQEPLIMHSLSRLFPESVRANNGYERFLLVITPIAY